VDIDDNYITLTENKAGNATVLSKLENHKLKSGNHDIRFGVVRINNENRIVLTSDGETVIDYFDISPLDTEGKMTFKAELVGAGKGVAHTIDLEANNEHSGVIDHARTKNDVVTDTYKKFVINSDFARSRYYFKRTVDPNGDKEAKVKITFDQDLVQTGEEIYEEYTIDFTKGDDGWYCVGVGTCPEVIIEITSSGKGTLPVGDYAGFGTTDNSTIEVNNLYNRFSGLFIAKADRDLFISKDKNIKMSANALVVNKEYLFPVQVAEAMGGIVEISGNSIKITKNDNVGEFTIGSNVYTVNGQQSEMKNAVYTASDGVAMISIDAIAKVLNKKVYKHYFGLVLIADEIDKTFKLTTNEAENVIKKFY
jgi:hypothetical protein